MIGLCLKVSQKPTVILRRLRKAHRGGNSAFQRDGERSRPGCCSRRPRVEPSRRSKPAGVGPRVSLPTARAPLAALEAGALPISYLHVPLRGACPTVLRVTKETVSTMLGPPATGPLAPKRTACAHFLCAVFQASAHYTYEGQCKVTLNCCEVTFKTARKARSPNWCSGILTSSIQRCCARCTAMPSWRKM